VRQWLTQEPLCGALNIICVLDFMLLCLAREINIVVFHSRQYILQLHGKQYSDHYWSTILF
jgi:hypothetical protein